MAVSKFQKVALPTTLYTGCLVIQQCGRQGPEPWHYPWCMSSGCLQPSNFQASWPLPACHIPCTCPLWLDTAKCGVTRHVLARQLVDRLPTRQSLDGLPRWETFSSGFLAFNKGRGTYLECFLARWTNWATCGCTFDSYTVIHVHGYNYIFAPMNYMFTCRPIASSLRVLLYVHKHNLIGLANAIVIRSFKQFDLDAQELGSFSFESYLFYRLPH